jgi:soluble lytic murein transglycosylase
VDRWIVRARSSDEAFTLAQIPFVETREYVGRVLEARVEYREKYERELGL